mmetsp:Transcript_7937/g.23809  ORF Transcript_7937/g.23809 Transcript_7937/m.23809 type:complete len:280 (-) Transcript_7937:663-1502(-)
MPFVPTFGARFHEMVSAGYDCIGWSADGSKVWVTNPERLARDVIPKYFGHSSYASLTRSLHAHSFNKISSTDWMHPAFTRDEPEKAKTITRKRPRSKEAPPAISAAITANADPLFPPLRATSTELSDETHSSDAPLTKVARYAPGETPSPEVAARLAALAEQIRAEKKAAIALQHTLDRLEAHSTRARREELQLRLVVVHLASVLANAAAGAAPITAATQAAATLLARGQLPSPDAGADGEMGCTTAELLSLCDLNEGCSDKCLADHFAEGASLVSLTA